MLLMHLQRRKKVEKSAGVWDLWQKDTSWMRGSPRQHTRTKNQQQDECKVWIFSKWWTILWLGINLIVNVYSTLPSPRLWFHLFLQDPAAIICWCASTVAFEGVRTLCQLVRKCSRVEYNWMPQCTGIQSWYLTWQVSMYTLTPSSLIRTCCGAKRGDGN